MIERHWDGIVSYCNPNNKVSPGLVEGINNKVRVFSRKNMRTFSHATVKSTRG